MLSLSFRPLKRNVGKRLIHMVGVFGLATIALAMTQSFVVALILIFIAAAADAVSMFIRASLVPLATPEQMRGRVLAVESVFIGASNELGAAESGVAAALLGLVGAILFGGAGTLLVVILWWRRFWVYQKFALTSTIDTNNCFWSFHTFTLLLLTISVTQVF